MRHRERGPGTGPAPRGQRVFIMPPRAVARGEIVFGCLRAPTVTGLTMKEIEYRLGVSEAAAATVAEAAVIGKSSPLRGQILEAFLVLAPGAAPASSSPPCESTSRR